MTDLFGRLMIDIDGLNLSNEDKFLLSNKHIGNSVEDDFNNLFFRSFSFFGRNPRNVNPFIGILETL